MINGILGIVCLVNKSGERCTEQKIYEPQQLKRALCALVACLVIIYNSFLRQNRFLSAHALNFAKPDYNSSWELRAGSGVGRFRALALIANKYFKHEAVIPTLDHLGTYKSSCIDAANTNHDHVFIVLASSRLELNCPKLAWINGTVASRVPNQLAL